MSARRIGNGIIVITLLVLLIDWLVRLQGPATTELRGPAGFPWPTNGLGRVEIGIEGAFTIDMEESLANADGGAQRLPEIRIEGRDPRPKDQGMSMQQAVITGFAISAEGASAESRVQVIARAPTAWAALKEVAGATHFDRDQLWRLISPVVDFPGLAAGQDFVLEADAALFNPTTNEIHCPDHFLLHSPAMKIDGFGLRLDPAQGTIRFGETIGAVDWELHLQSGGVVKGYADSGGSLMPTEDGLHELRLNASKTCRTDVPAEAGLPGRLETNGLRFLVEAVEGSWLPREWHGLQPSSWAGAEMFLSGQDSFASWEGDEIQRVIMDGPVFGHIMAPEQAWVGAQGGAWIDALQQQVHFHRLVTLHRSDGVLHTSRAEFHQDGFWQAGGGVHISGPSGLAIAETAFAAAPEPGGRRGMHALGAVRFLPSAPELDLLTGPEVQVAVDGSARLGPGFVARGIHPQGLWELQGTEVSTRRRGDRRLTIAHGDVVWERSDLKLVGDRFEHDDLGQGTLHGRPAKAFMQLPEGEAIASSNSLVRAGERLVTRGKPRFDLPAAALGLAGDRVLIYSDHLHRSEDGVWHARQNIRLEGALSGGARAADWEPGGALVVWTSPEHPPLVGTTAEGAEFRGKARVWRLFADGNIEAEGEVDGDYQPADRSTPFHVTGERGQFLETSGWIQGGVAIDAEGVHATGRRADWHADARGEGWVITMLGPATFTHEKASGEAARMIYDLAGPTLQLFEGRDPATLRLKDGRNVHAEWIEVDPDRMTFSSRNGVVRQVPIENDDDGS